MNIFKQKKEATIRIIASDKNWIESDAVNQLHNTAKLKGVRLAVGLPDLHPGRVHPIGAAFIAEGWLYPQLVGNDIGCGMGLWKTDLKLHKLNMDKWVSKLNNLDLPWDGNITAWLQHYEAEHSDFDNSLGTIGGGNHFAELMSLEASIDQGACDKLKLDKKIFYLLVHSGSRGLGEHILHNHIDSYGKQGLQEDSLAAINYIDAHDKAVKWAEANRSLIAHRFLSSLHGDGKKIINVNHNAVLPQYISGKKYWLHRKGASSATEGMVIIPGSRGDLSYLVQPIGSQDKNAYSLAHGAGRKWSRSSARHCLRKYRIGDFLKTSLGGRVICENKDLIYEEAPQAYKDIGIVVNDMVNEGLIRIIAKLRPVITYKTRRRK